MTLLEPSPTPHSNGTPKRLYLPHQRTIDLRGAPGAGTDLTNFSPTVVDDQVDQQNDTGAETDTDAGRASDDDFTSEDATPARRSSPRQQPFPALRFGRVRILSLAKIAAVFSVIGFLVTVGTLTLVWNVLLRFGLVSSAEEAVATGLGLDQFTIAGGEWFGVVVAGTAVLFVFLLLVTILLALVYNATCALFGGVAIEARPVRRLTVRQRLLHGIRRWREARA